MRRLLSVALFVSGVVAGTPSVAAADAKWGPFRGQVVDQDTGEPIAGSVVVAVWWETQVDPVQSTTRFYDAREAVADSSGRFEIPRRWAPPWKWLVRPAEISIFAPSYAEARILVTSPGGQEFVDPTIVQMRRLTTREERLRNVRGFSLVDVPNDKIPRLREATNREWEALGVRP